MVQTNVGAAAARPLSGVLAVHRQDGGVLPRQADPGAGQLQGGQIGQDFQCIKAQLLRQVWRNAVAQRVTGGQHHAGLVRGPGRAYPFGQGAELSCQIMKYRTCFEFACEQRQGTGAAHHHIGGAKVGQCGGAQTGHPIIEHADHAAGVGILSEGVGCHSVSKSGCWRWPMPVRPAVTGEAHSRAGADHKSATFWPEKSHTNTLSWKALP